MTTPEFTITRTFNAPRELVWKAWTDKFELAHWFHPMGVTVESVSVDLRVGGRYRYTMVNESTGEEYPPEASTWRSTRSRSSCSAGATPTPRSRAPR